jgi:hypothetical protein
VHRIAQLKLVLGVGLDVARNFVLFVRLRIHVNPHEELCSKFRQADTLSNTPEVIGSFDEEVGSFDDLT